MKIQFDKRCRVDTPPGFPPASRYVRRFWCPIIGIAALGCYIGISEAIEEGRTHLSPAELVSALGLDDTTHLTRPLACLVRNDLARGIEGGLAVQQYAPGLKTSDELQLPPELRATHRNLRRRGLVTTSEPGSAPDSPSPVDEMLHRARHTALSMFRLGSEPAEVERALARRQLHPSIAHRAIEWAASECSAVTTTTEAADRTADRIIGGGADLRKRLAARPVEGHVASVICLPVPERPA